LRRALAAHHGLDANRIVVGAGSVALLQQLVLAVSRPGDEVMYGWRSFEAYPRFPLVAGAKPVEIPLDATCAYDLSAMSSAVTDKT